MFADRKAHNERTAFFCSDHCRGYGICSMPRQFRNQRGSSVCMVVCMQSSRQLCSEPTGRTQRKACRVIWGLCCAQERGRGIRVSILNNSVCLRGHELPATYSSTLSTAQLKRKRNHCLFFAMLVLGHQRAIKPRYKHRNQPMYEYACHTSWHVVPTDQLQTSANHSTAGQSLFCIHTVYTRTCTCVNQHHHISFLSHGLRFNISPVMEGSSTRNLPRETND